MPGQEIHGGVDGIGSEPVGMARVVPRRDRWAQVRVRRVEGSGHGARLDRLGPWQPGALAIFARPFPPRDSLGYVLAMTTADVRVRDMTEADVERIAAIWYEGWRDGHVGHVSDELVAIRTLDAFRARTGRRVGETRVATVDGAVAGFTMVIGDEIEQVYVAGDHRGAGVSPALMADAEAALRAAGVETAWLAVVAGNARARRFYEKQGWADAGSVSYEAATGDGRTVVVPSRRYEKSLRG